MAIPGMNAIMKPTLKLLAGGATSPRECLDGLKQHFRLTDDEMDERIPSGIRTRVFDRADWSIFHLMHAGLVERPRRGVYLITDEGRRVLEQGPSELDLTYLKTLPAYADWTAKTKSRDSHKKTDQAATPTTEEAADLPPEERVETAIKEIDTELSEEILTRVLECSPAFFERLIVGLLIAMGYGRGRDGAGHRIGRSGDGGIDGIINEDALGLDAVYIQAKRYQPESKIGRPAIQQFVGSLTGEGATKGVFVTTSDFSTEARDYVRRVQQRIVLINGTELARLLIAHEIGVRARKTYVLRSVDEDYFIET